MTAEEYDEFMAEFNKLVIPEIITYRMDKEGNYIKESE